MNIKICIIAPSVMAVRGDLSYGGAEAIIWQLCRQLGLHKMEYTLVAPKGSDAPGGTLFETVEPQKRGDKWTGDEEWDAFEKYETAFDWSKDFDVVHSHDHQGLAYKLRCPNPGIKIVHTCHGLQTWARPGGMPMFYGPPNLLTLSKFHQEITKQPGGTVTGAVGIDSRIVVHGVDTSIYQPCPKEEVGDYFLIFGLMAPHKGHVLPLTVWTKLRYGNQSTGPLMIAGEDQFVGDRNYVRTIKELCAGPDDKPIASYLGNVTQEKKVDLFQHARGIILPFLAQPGEAWSLIVLEALACGCPVISTPNGAIPEMIENGKTGFLVQTDDELWAAIQKTETLDRTYVAGSVGGKWDLDATFLSHMEHYQATIKGDKWW
jgi:glycosyltransferase involved in cell wall biosynthesis